MRIKDQWNEQRILQSRSYVALLLVGLATLALVGALVWPVVTGVLGRFHSAR